MPTLGKLPFSWLMVFQLLSRELPKGQPEAVPLLLAAGAPAPQGSVAKGTRLEEPGCWAAGG